MSVWLSYPDQSRNFFDYGYLYHVCQSVGHLQIVIGKVGSVWTKNMVVSMDMMPFLGFFYLYCITWTRHTVSAARGTYHINYINTGMVSAVVDNVQVLVCANNSKKYNNIFEILGSAMDICISSAFFLTNKLPTSSTDLDIFLFSINDQNLSTQFHRNFPIKTRPNGVLIISGKCSGVLQLSRLFLCWSCQMVSALDNERFCNVHGGDSEHGYNDL